jgi:hypothetical protein
LPNKYYYINIKTLLRLRVSGPFTTFKSTATKVTNKEKDTALKENKYGIFLSKETIHFSIKMCPVYLERTLHFTLA